MKTKSLFIVILGFLVFLIAVPAHSWQGRMGGMGDPYGLIADESDFLVHPAGIANGKETSFYGDYRFTWNDVGKWNYNLTGVACGTCHMSYKASGNEQKHEALFGAAFPLGPGKMGMFFQYTGRRGDFDGNGIEDSNLNKFSLRSDLDSFALRLLYGLPMGAFKLGGEIQLAYRHEKNETIVNWGDEWFKNGTFFTIFEYPETLPFMFPYDSKYWEALFKSSLGGAMGPAKFAFTMQGGFIFAGEHKMGFEWLGVDTPFDTYSVDANGKIKGWRIGGDLWVRYPLKDGLSLPFLLKVGYQKKTRDADGPAIYNGVFDDLIEYSKIREKNFNVEVGGGVDKEIIKGARVAAGIYYSYLNNKNGIWGYGIETDGDITPYENPSFPDHREHQVILRLIGEKEFSPMVAIRMGMNFFYGWVKEDFKSNGTFGWGPPYSDHISLGGNHWGIGASLGGTVRFQRFSLEPFLGGGYQKLKLTGDGSNPDYPAVYDMDRTKSGWSIGGGLSIKF